MVKKKKLLANGFPESIPTISPSKAGGAHFQLLPSKVREKGSETWTCRFLFLFKVYESFLCDHCFGLHLDRRSKLTWGRLAYAIKVGTKICHLQVGLVAERQVHQHPDAMAGFALHLRPATRPIFEDQLMFVVCVPITMTIVIIDPKHFKFMVR